MKKFAVLLTVLLACAPCMDWTRFRGKVKGLNRKAKIATLENREGDVFGVPITDDVKILSRKGEAINLKDVVLDMDLILIRVPDEKAPEHTESFQDMNTQK